LKRRSDGRIEGASGSPSNKAMHLTVGFGARR
jgi:hypothetical protein